MLLAREGQIKNSITDTALGYSDKGMCVLPLRPGTKKPIAPWKQYQETRPTEAQLIASFKGNDCGIAVVAGAVSGGLCCRDFDVCRCLPTVGRR